MKKKRTDIGLEKMLDAKNRWSEYWLSVPERRYDVIWRVNMAFFLNAVQPLMNFCEDDIVLDIGSGPGFLIDALKNQVKEIHCCDISRRLLSQARDSFAMHNNCFFYKLPMHNYTDFTFFGKKRFSKVVCQSVVQYYKSHFEIEQLIDNVRKIGKPGGKFLISDMPAEKPHFHAIFSILLFGMRHKCLLEILKHVIGLRFSDYYNALSQVGLLVFSEDMLKKMITKNNLNAEIITSQLTINQGRIHLLITL